MAINRNELELFLQQYERAFGPNPGAGGGRPNTRDPNETVAAVMASYIRRGVLVINEDGSLGPGPRFNPNDTLLVGQMNRINQGFAEANQRESTTAAQQDPIQSAINNVTAQPTAQTPTRQPTGGVGSGEGQDLDNAINNLITQSSTQASTRQPITGVGSGASTRQPIANVGSGEGQDLTDPTIPEPEPEPEKDEEETVSSRLNDWWEGIVERITTTARGSASGPITLPGMGGVIINTETITDPGSWRVFLPGVIPNLPSGPTILGTIDQILQNPQIVLGGLINDISTVFTNPEQILSEIFTDSVGEGGLVTTAVMTDVISRIIDRIEDATDEILRNEDGFLEVNEQGSILGGQEEESIDEDILGDTTNEDDPFTDTGSTDSSTDDPVVSTPEVGTTTPEIGTTDVLSTGDSAITGMLSTGESQIGEQPQQQLGATETVSEGGGGAGVQSGSSMFDEFLRRLRPIQIPQISGISQLPQKDALTELNDFINRQNGLFTGGNQII